MTTSKNQEFQERIKVQKNGVDPEILVKKRREILMRHHNKYRTSRYSSNRKVRENGWEK